MDNIVVYDNITAHIEIVDKKRYRIVLDDGTMQTILATIKSTTLPTELNTERGKGKAVYDSLKPSIKKYLVNNDKSDTVRDIKQVFTRILGDLEKEFNHKLLNHSKQVEEERDLEVERLVTEIEIQMDKIYPDYYDYFHNRCTHYNYTSLEMISRITQGLGVGLTIEVIKAYFGYFQTYCGLKGTNVIAVGSQSAGKTHVLEQALDLIPKERVHRGVKSVAYFFRKYNHMDLTGHIFYLGDLGGENSDSNTIEMRDILKQLSTDGYIERGLVDENNNVEDQWVKGYPCVTYSTVLEDMINEQERSRSMIITPPEVEPKALMYFKSTMNSPGEYQESIQQIQADKLNATGLVYDFNKNMEDYFFFNPYLFGVTEYMKSEDDFNRKIDEFNQILVLCCQLNDGFKVDYEYLDKDTMRKTTKPLYIASKQDVYNALKIFDKSSGLMPTEVKLAKGLIKKYTVLKPSIMPLDGYEALLREEYERLNNTLLATTSSDSNSDEPLLTRENKDNVIFTETILRKKHSNQRWYRLNKEGLTIKLNRLYLNNILVRVGKNNDKEIVYALNINAKDKLDNQEPVFQAKDIKEGRTLFHKTFPNASDEFNEFMDNDERNKVTKNAKIVFDTECNDKIYNIPW